MKRPSNEEDIVGKLHLSWELFNQLDFETLNNRCRGCADPFFVGELTTLLALNQDRLRFHESCITQVAMVLVSFLEATDDIRNDVTVRQN